MRICASSLGQTVIGSHSTFRVPYGSNRYHTLHRMVLHGVFSHCEVRDREGSDGMAIESAHSDASRS